jgi:hypothetical protein
MAKNSNTSSTKKRLKVEVLPSAEKQLTPNELKQVKGRYEMSKSDTIKAPKPKGYTGDVFEGTGI